VDISDGDVVMLMGIFGQAVVGPIETARHTDSAFCRTTVGGKFNEVLATKHQTMHEISLLEHVVVQHAEQI
jgi:hypothetical protein